MVCRHTLFSLFPGLLVEYASDAVDLSVDISLNLPGHSQIVLVAALEVSLLCCSHLAYQVEKFSCIHTISF